MKIKFCGYGPSNYKIPTLGSLLSKGILERLLFSKKLHLFVAIPLQKSYKDLSKSKHIFIIAKSFFCNFYMYFLGKVFYSPITFH